MLSFSNIRIIWLAIALAVSLLAGPAVGSDTFLPAVLILDSSGSMAGETADGSMKLDAARAVIGTMLEEWPKGGELAIMAYGHRRKSDCTDIETLAPMGVVAPVALRKRLGTLKPRGKTPLSSSLREAVRLLPATGGAIVLVSDGIETCDADPCEVARALKAAQIRLSIHVVGFGLKREEVPQLACIAENAGGRFFDAGSVDELAKALKVVSVTIAAPLTLPEPEPAPAPLPVIIRVALKAVAGSLGPIVDAPARWTIVNAVGDTVYEGESRALSLELPAGSYRVSVAAANAATETEINVTNAAGESHDVEISAGRLDLSLVASRTARPYDDAEAQGVEWVLEPLDGQGPIVVPGLARPSLLLAPGRYRVRARLKGLAGEVEVTVAAGTPVSTAIDLKLGSLTLQAVLASGGEAISDAAFLKWRIGEGNAVQVIEGEAQPKIVLPEGRVPVTLTIAGAEIAGTADVRNGEETLTRITVEGGELRLSARLAPGTPPLEDWRDTSWVVSPLQGVAAGGKDIEIVEATPTVPLPPGRWRVTLQSGTVTKEEELQLGPGQSVPVAIELGAARLILQAQPAVGERAVNTLFSVIAIAEDGVPAEQSTYEAGASEETSTILPAGRWRVILTDSDGRSGTADVTLRAGEVRRITVSLK